VVHILFFLSIFYDTREGLGSAYKNPIVESFCDFMILEQDKLGKIRLIIIASTSNKSLVVQQKFKSKNPKKHNNNKNKGPKPSVPDFAPNGDKGAKSKSEKTSDTHCNFFRKYSHV
jgi:hypothetical protein